jgi:hypothetical protein
VLRECIVDDLHLAGIFASLLETYTQRFRERFVNISRVVETGGGAGFISKTHAPNGDMTETSLFPNAMRVDSQTQHSHGTQSSNEFMTDQDWLLYPFDPSIAPFGVDMNQGFSGFVDNELDFIWNANV